MKPATIREDLEQCALGASEPMLLAQESGCLRIK